MKIKFNHVDEFMQPLDESLISIADGYEIVVKLPPQGVGLLSDEELKDSQQTGQNIILLNLLISIVFAKLIGMLIFDQVIQLQIFAHLAMTALVMPANVLQDFRIGVSIVSFDFFSPFDYIDVNFTLTEAITPNFEWMGYTTQNFLNNLGSIIIFAIL